MSNKYNFMRKEGQRVLVGRGTKPELAVELGKQAKTREQLDAVLTACGPYRFVGFCSEDGVSILDERHRVIGALQPGDSFFTERPLNSGSLPARELNRNR